MRWRRRPSSELAAVVVGQPFEIVAATAAGEDVERVPPPTRPSLEGPDGQRVVTDVDTGLCPAGGGARKLGQCRTRRPVRLVTSVRARVMRGVQLPSFYDKAGRGPVTVE